MTKKPRKRSHIGPEHTVVRHAIQVDDLEPKMFVKGFVHQCPSCDLLFIGNVRTTFCSSACRCADNRQRNLEARRAHDRSRYYRKRVSGLNVAEGGEEG